MSKLSVCLLNEKEVAMVFHKNSVVIHANTESRDAIIAANAFLAVFSDSDAMKDGRWRVERVIRHLSDMLYGFPEETPPK